MYKNTFRLWHAKSVLKILGGLEQNSEYPQPTQRNLSYDILQVQYIRTDASATETAGL